LQKKLEERVEHLLQDVATQAHEIARLQVFETELKAEKDKVAAARIQVHSTLDRNLAYVSIRQHTAAARIQVHS
jgi:hypothetical protein